MSNYVELSVHVHQELKRRLRAEDPGLDDETLADTVEGLTDLHEILAAIVRAAIIDEALAIGLKTRARDMQARLGRLEERAGIRRRIVRDSMIDAEIKKITDAEFTISVRAGNPSLVVIEEALVPPQYWQSRDPTLKKLELLAALKAGAEIGGVQLSNPEPVLSVRTR